MTVAARRARTSVRPLDGEPFEGEEQPRAAGRTRGPKSEEELSAPCDEARQVEGVAEVIAVVVHDRPVLPIGRRLDSCRQIGRRGYRRRRPRRKRTASGRSCSQKLASSLRRAIDAAPHRLNHNTETVPRRYEIGRHGGPPSDRAAGKQEPRRNVRSLLDVSLPVKRRLTRAACAREETWVSRTPAGARVSRWLVCGNRHGGRGTEPGGDEVRIQRRAVENGGAGHARDHVQAGWDRIGGGGLCRAWRERVSEHGPEVHAERWGMAAGRGSV